MSPSEISALSKEKNDEPIFCVCGASGDSEFSMEELTRCSNPQCDPGWFHLRCVGLPDHPPRRLNWVCPTCRSSDPRAATHVKGLVNVRANDPANKVAKAWLAAEKRRVKRSTMRKEANSKTRQAVEELEELEKPGDVQLEQGESETS